LLFSITRHEPTDKNAGTTEFPLGNLLE
jgi:hypothetical protein